MDLFHKGWRITCLHEIKSIRIDICDFISRLIICRCEYGSLVIIRLKIGICSVADFLIYIEGILCFGDIIVNIGLYPFLWSGDILLIEQLGDQ